MDSKTRRSFQTIDLDQLDTVQGGADPANRVYGWSGTIGYGIGSFTATRTDEGNWYVSPGFGLGSPSFRVGASVDRISITPKEGNTADDVLKEWSVGGAGHVGIGGSVSANDSGKVVGVGVGLDAGVGASYGLKAEVPSNGSQGTPVYDPMGNFTGTYENAPTNTPTGPTSELQSTPTNAYAGEPTATVPENTYADNTNTNSNYTSSNSNYADNSNYAGDYSGGDASSDVA